MEIITTQKGGEALIWQGCKFTLNRKMANGKKYWRCAKRICPARITTEGNEVLQQTNGHNHPVDGVEAEVERVNHELRKQAREEVTVVSRLTEIEMGSHGWLTVNAPLQDQSTTRMRTAQCNYNYYITTTRTQYQITNTLQSPLFLPSTMMH